MLLADIALDPPGFVDFRSDRSDGDHPETDGSSFTFLGFCHVLGKIAERKPRRVAGNGKETLRPRAGGSYGLVDHFRAAAKPSAIKG
jgi:hypothetical protein